MGVGGSGLSEPCCCTADEITCDELKERSSPVNVLFEGDCHEPGWPAKSTLIQEPRVSSANKSSRLSKLQQLGVLTKCSTRQKANEYVSDPRDPIDVEFANILKNLSTEARDVLTLRHDAPGKYEIDGRPCTVYREMFCRSLLVHEEEVDVANAADLPLWQYMQLAASVVLDFQRTRPRLLTFVQGDVSKDLHSVSEAEREASMRLACVQAGVWEGAEPPPLLPPSSPRHQSLSLGATVACSNSNISISSNPSSMSARRVCPPCPIGGSSLAPLGLGPGVVYSASNTSAASNSSHSLRRAIAS